MQHPHLGLPLSETPTNPQNCLFPFVFSGVVVFLPPPPPPVLSPFSAILLDILRPESHREPPTVLRAEAIVRGRAAQETALHSPSLKIFLPQYNGMPGAVCHLTQTRLWGHQLRTGGAWQHRWTNHQVTSVKGSVVTTNNFQQLLLHVTSSKSNQVFLFSLSQIVFKTD